MKEWNTTVKFCSQKCHYMMGHSKETKKKLSIARFLQSDPRLGTRHTDIVKKRMSESHKLSFVKDPTLAIRLSLIAKGHRRSPLTEFKKGLPNNGHRFTSENNSGILNSNWKGGVTKLQERVRKCFKYRQWRSDVFQRDRYTCQECSARNGIGNGETILNADHIKPFSLILQENSIDTFEKAMICEELWNINNGRTLCLGCHKKTPTYLNNVAIITLT